jgi:predicted glycoside hydrolase/deacetylase ChbG (UPF0249 family)
MKYLIIDAGDFGYSRVFNIKILEQIEKKFFTSVSAMVSWIDNQQEDQVDKLRRIHDNFDISVGLHVEFKNENFTSQIQEQFEKFISIFNFEPDYIDIHKYIYLQNGYPEIMKFCAENGIPCKNYEIAGPKAIMPESLTYDATEKGIEEIKTWLKNLENGKIHLIQFHPGIYDPDSKSSFNEIREVDAKNVEAINYFFKEFDIKPASFKFLKK